MFFIFETLFYLALATIQQLLCWDHRCMPHPAGETLLRSKDLITDENKCLTNAPGVVLALGLRYALPS